MRIKTNKKIFDTSFIVRVKFGREIRKHCSEQKQEVRAATFKYFFGTLGAFLGNNIFGSVHFECAHITYKKPRQNENIDRTGMFDLSWNHPLEGGSSPLLHALDTNKI